MNTLQEIQNEYAIENGLDNWPELVEYYIYWDNAKLLFHIEEVAKRFAIEVAKETLRNAAENATITGNWDAEIGDVIHSVHKESILSHDNIPKL